MKDIHLSTPFARMASLTGLLCLNVPFWFLAALAIPVCLELFVVGWIGALAVDAALAAALVVRLGRVGGNLAFEPGAVTLDGRRVVGLRNWSVKGGWIEVRTPEGVAMRVGEPHEIAAAVQKLGAFPGLEGPIADRVDGFTASCEPRMPGVDPIFAIGWSVMAVLLGFSPAAAVMVLTAGEAAVCAALAFAVATVAITVPSAAVGAQLTAAATMRPRVELELTGNVLRVSSGRKQVTHVLSDPTTDVRFARHPEGVTMRVGDDALVALVTEPFAEAVQTRLDGLQRPEGDADSVPEALSRVRTTADRVRERGPGETT